MKKKNLPVLVGDSALHPSSGQRLFFEARSSRLVVMQPRAGVLVMVQAEHESSTGAGGRGPWRVQFAPPGRGRV